MTRVACYYRISSDPKGLAEGVDRQEADCRARAAREGWRDLYEVRENDTGASRYSRKKRPLYAELLRRAGAGEFDVILAYSMSRLTRAPRELEDLIDLAERTKVRVVTCNSLDYDLNTGNGRYFARQEAARDANEADAISERVRRHKLGKFEKYGFSSGTRPFGFHAPAPGDDALRVNDTEAAMIRDGAAHVIAGESVAALVRAWNESGTTGVRGKQWRRDTVRKALMQERNVPAILDAETADTVRAILNNNARTYARGSAPVYPLSGIAECGVPGCGARMVYRRIGNAYGKQPGYGCETGHNTIRTDAAERVVRAAVALWYMGGHTDPAREDEIPHRTIADVQRELAALLTERTEISQDVATGLFDRAAMRPRLIELRDAAETLNAELEQIRQTDGDQAMKETAVAAVEAQLTQGLPETLAGQPAPLERAVRLRQRWDGMSVEQQKRVLAANFRVVVLPASQAGYGGKRVKVSRHGIDLTADDADI